MRAILRLGRSNAAAWTGQVRDALADFRSPRGRAESLVEDQQAWFRRRSLCAFSERQAGCLRAHILNDRRSRCAAQSLPELAQSGAMATCSGRRPGIPRMRASSWAIGTGHRHDARARAQFRSTAEPRDDWSPFVRFSTEARRSPLAARSSSHRVPHAATVSRWKSGPSPDAYAIRLGSHIASPA